MKHAYVLVKEFGVYVKDGEFFESEGGLVSSWGRAWERIKVTTLHDARRIGIEMRRARFPNSHRTLGEDESMNKIWPEAIGH